MNGKKVFARRVTAVSAGFALATILVWALGFNVEALTFSGQAGGEMAVMETQHLVSAPLKPDWVEALLDQRATAMQRPQAAPGLVQGSAPLKPDWVEAMLDARATALRALLEARDLEAAH